MKLFDTIIQGIHKNMDLSALRQNMINANIANIDTPGYKPVDLDFKSQLAQFLANGEDRMAADDASHLGQTSNMDDVTGTIIEQATETGPDQNGVDLDRQMANLSANAMDFQASAKMMRKKLGFLKYVINEAR
jgi:flagellar basal-body rod protein FlgB